MKRLHSYTLFYVYFVAITYGFAKDVQVLNGAPSYDLAHPISSYLIMMANKFGLPPDLIRIYIGSMFAVFFSNYLAVAIDRDQRNISTFIRIAPIIAFNFYIQFSYATYQGGIALSNFLLPLSAFLIVPLFLFISIYAKVCAADLLDFESKFKIEILHLYWLVFPFYYYMVRIINEWHLSMQMFGNIIVPNLFGVIPALISTISFIVYVMPMYFVIKILKREYLPKLSGGFRFVVNFLVITIGYLVCGSVAEGVDWIKGNLYFL